MMKKITSLLLFGGALFLGACASQEVKRDVTVAIAADTHFDKLPENDQYYHVLAMNRLGDTLRMNQRELDGVILAGDMIDKLAPGVLDLFKQRYEKGEGEKRIHTTVYPGFGNHDLDSVLLDMDPDPMYQQKVMLAYMDSALEALKKEGRILNYDPLTRCYSWNIQDVHFIQGQRVANDSSYCRPNMNWLAEDLKKYASDGNPVVYIQHYGFDKWALDWWSEETREKLFDIFEPYNLVGFFVGHTHEVSVEHYRNVPIYQVNNAWADGDGKASFAVLHLTNDVVEVKTCVVEDGKGHYTWQKPELNKQLKNQ